MARHKEEDFKDFMISERKKTGSGLTNAPVWIMQKAGKRIWNSKQKRTWKTIDMNDKFLKHKQKQGPKNRRSGDHKVKGRKMSAKVE